MYQVKLDTPVPRLESVIDYRKNQYTLYGGSFGKDIPSMIQLGGIHLIGGGYKSIRRKTSFEHQHTGALWDSRTHFRECIPHIHGPASIARPNIKNITGILFHGTLKEGIGSVGHENHPDNMSKIKDLEAQTWPSPRSVDSVYRSPYSLEEGIRLLMLNRRFSSVCEFYEHTQVDGNLPRRPSRCRRPGDVVSTRMWK